MKICLLICVHDIGVDINKWWLLKETILFIASFMSNHHVFVDVSRGLLDEEFPCLNHSIITISNTYDV